MHGAIEVAEEEGGAPLGVKPGGIVRPAVQMLANASLAFQQFGGKVADEAWRAPADP